MFSAVLSATVRSYRIFPPAYIECLHLPREEEREDTAKETTQDKKSTIACRCSNGAVQVKKRRSDAVPRSETLGEWAAEPYALRRTSFCGEREGFRIIRDRERKHGGLKRRATGVREKFGHAATNKGWEQGSNKKNKNKKNKLKHKTLTQWPEAVERLGRLVSSYILL